MTREEFMDHAKLEIDRAFSTQRNRMMNLVEQAWAEGKRNAEVSGVIDVVKDVLEKMNDSGKESHISCRECAYYQDNNDGYPHPDCKWNHDETPDPDDFCSAWEKIG